MAMIEQGEFLIVMEEGVDTRVLARLEHYELAVPVWMAAKLKFPRENLLFRISSSAMTVRRSRNRPCPAKPR
jgi:hypothetical protein